MFAMKNCVKRKHLQKRVPYISAFTVGSYAVPLKWRTSVCQEQLLLLHTLCSYFKKTRVLQVNGPLKTLKKFPK
jgi:hypothetical protein